MASEADTGESMSEKWEGEGKGEGEGETDLPNENR